MAPRNLLNLEDAHKTFGRDPIFNGVSLGVAAGERIGVVGRNGGGKSTLLKVMAGLEPADSGRVTRATSLQLGVLSQVARFTPDQSIADFVLGDRDEHDWASEARSREVLDALLGGYDAPRLARVMGQLSGGEQRRVQLAHLLLQNLDLLLLDEPTNHLDVEAVDWLARHLRSRPTLSVVVVTHDRWFLDEVSDRMWEVVDGRVEEYDGGYSAFVLAKAERERQSSVEQQRRSNLIRKELAWLRRGPPARTSKPKFRIDSANALISGEPPPRNQVELLAFAGARLGKTVFETHDVSLAFGDRLLLDHLTWDVGPGDRLGVIGVNGAGKTSLVRLLLGLQQPSAGRVVKGVTVKPAYLSQHLEELDPTWRVLEAVEQVAQRVELSKGRELSATQLCERLGFGGDAQWTPVGDLSGGERRRLQLTRLLMGGPNVLVLDEPTNDFDVETLTALEDLLDSFGGTLLVISHDRYFLERVCDRFVGLMGDGAVRDLPGGLEQYLELTHVGQARQPPVAARAARAESPPGRSVDGSAAGATASKTARLDERAQRKELVRLERLITRIDQKESDLHRVMSENATDHVRVSELNEQLREVISEKVEAEEAWLALSVDAE